MKGLIVSDVDGTLLPENGRTLDPALFTEIRRLQSEGWIFAPASGRQYHSLMGLFAPLAGTIPCLCENGAVVFSSEGTPLSKTVIPAGDALALCEDILAQSSCEVLISGENTSYILPKREDMLTLMRDVKGNRVMVLASLAQVPEPIIKISAYCARGAEAIDPALAARWPQYHPAVAGAQWLDFTLSDKGTGLRALCAALDVSPGDVIAFGDNYNDLPMLALAGRGYLMSTAAPPLLARFPRHCACVLSTLRSL